MSLKASSWRYAWSELRRNRRAMLGLGVLIAILVIVAIGDYVIPHQVDERFDRFMPPGSSPNIWLGTDYLGRDVLSRLIIGARTTLFVGFGATVITVLIGFFVGAVAGYFKGITDWITMRVSEIFLAIPSFFLYILIASMITERSFFTLMLLLGFVRWPQIARIVRADFIALRERTFTLSARAMGASSWRIILRHLLPNALASLIVTATMSVAAAILMESAISFVGFGDISIPSWGYMLSEGRDYLSFAWWIATFPGLMIFIIVLSLNFLGDGLRDALDPRLRVVV